MRAFAAASQRIDTLSSHPAVSLTCAVVTADCVAVAWTGGLIACLLDGQRLVRESVPHTIGTELLIKRKLKLETLTPSARNGLGAVTRWSGPSRDPDQQPEIEVWPAMERGHKLVLAHADFVEALRHAVPPSHLDERSWLTAVLERCPRANDRFAAMITL